MSGSVMASYISYLRIPAMASSAIAVLLSGALYFKQKWVGVTICAPRLMVKCSELIYPRSLPAGSRTDEGFPRPVQFGISDYDDLQIPTPDGESLSAFFIRPSNRGLARNVTILMFHGNAGNIGHRVPIAKVLEENSGCNILMLEYRGYGLSTGTPNEEGIMIDAQTGLDYIRHQKSTQGGKIIVYGQSLGGAVGIQLVARNQEAGDIAALILENTFTSMRKLIPRYMGWV
jgi:abhydrolase domain-containing protein 13